MFDLITGATDHIPSRPAVPVLVSLMAQLGLVTAVGVLSVVIGRSQLPETPTMIAFVAEVPAAVPPPPPPPAVPTAARAARPAARTAASAAALPPAEAPPHIEFEPAAGEEGLEEGVPGGVVGGVPGGIAGAVASEPPVDQPPPSPPPTPPRPAPVRVGGKVPQPSLVHRVEPVYPQAAVVARMQGIVILETIVGEDGRVLEVRLLRSAGDVLDREAIATIRQWRYAPLEIDGVPVRFLLTATLSFKLDT